MRNGLDSAMHRVLPDGQGLLALLGIAAVAAVLSNVVNNLPAVLVLLPLVAGGRARRGAGRADRRQRRPEPDLRRLSGEPAVAQRGAPRHAIAEFRRVQPRRPGDHAGRARRLAVLALWAGIALFGV